MSTFFAIILSVLVAILLAMAFPAAAPLLGSLFEASGTGGPILFGLLVAGFVGYSSYAAVYVPLRVFKRASPKGVFWVFVILSLFGQAATAWQNYEQRGRWLTCNRWIRISRNGRDVFWRRHRKGLCGGGYGTR